MSPSIKLKKPQIVKAKLPRKKRKSAIQPKNRLKASVKKQASSLRKESSPIQIPGAQPLPLFQQNLQNADEVLKALGSEFFEFLPIGLALSEGHSKPVLLMRAPETQMLLSIPLHPLEAGLTLTQSQREREMAPAHRMIRRILDSFHLKLDMCVFTEIRGYIHHVTLFFGNNKEAKTLTVRAEEALSMCLAHNTRIFASRDYVEASRRVDQELALQQSMVQPHPGLLQNPFKVLM